MSSSRKNRSRTRLGLSLIVAIATIAGVALIVTPASSEIGALGDLAVAKKKQKKITGKLSKGGYTVIALARNGKAKTDRAPNGKFELKPPAKKVTLHLRAPDGTYAGPIVVGTRKHGKRAIEGVYAGAKLGNVTVKVGKGFAKVKLRKKWVEKKREALARNGVPIGAGNFGRVPVKNVKDQVPGDLDRDGVADPLDIDDDGDKVLDNLDRKPRKGSRSRFAARADGEDEPQTFGIQSVMAGGLTRTSNANVPGTTDEDIKEFMRGNDASYLEMDILPGDSSELDCGQPQSKADPDIGGLIYCSKGGTGELSPDEAIPSGLEFPECCDSDENGLGEMVPGTSPGSGFGLIPFATSDQIGAGDLMFQRVSTAGETATFTGTLQYVFVTTPALVSYDDGQGNSATINYPVADDGPGTVEDPFPVKADSNGDVKVTMTFWRPQRRSIEPEPKNKWIDIGGLDYGIVAPDASWRLCGGGSLSSTDPDLRLIEAGFRGELDQGGFQDERSDQVADPDEKLTLTVNLTRCLAERGESFDVGEIRTADFNAMAPPPSIDGATAGAVFIRE